MSYPANPFMWLAFCFSLLAHALFFQYYKTETIQPGSINKQPIVTSINIQAYNNEAAVTEAIA
ncbi:MAG: hypothetical protein QM479_01980, partial [Pseudomonadota bacterium]